MNPSLPVILFAEDSPHDVEMTLDALAEQQIANDIVVVGDGQEALDYLRQQGRFEQRRPGNPLLVLLDLKMPRVDGIDVLRSIKKDPGLRQIPVVILTSSREEQDLVRSYDLGVNAYIVKPVGVPAFVQAVKNLGVFWALQNTPPHSQPRASSSSP